MKSKGWGMTPTRGDEAKNLVRFQHAARVSEEGPVKVRARYRSSAWRSILTHVRLSLSRFARYACIGSTIPPGRPLPKVAMSHDPQASEIKPRLDGNGTIKGRRWRVAGAGEGLEDTSQRDDTQLYVYCRVFGVE